MTELWLISLRRVFHYLHPAHTNFSSFWKPPAFNLTQESRAGLERIRMDVLSSTGKLKIKSRGPRGRDWTGSSRNSRLVVTAETSYKAAEIILLDIAWCKGSGYRALQTPLLFIQHIKLTSRGPTWSTDKPITPKTFYSCFKGPPLKASTLVRRARIGNCTSLSYTPFLKWE